MFSVTNNNNNNPVSLFPSSSTTSSSYHPFPPPPPPPPPPSSPLPLSSTHYHHHQINDTNFLHQHDLFMMSPFSATNYTDHDTSSNPQFITDHDSYINNNTMSDHHHHHHHQQHQNNNNIGFSSNTLIETINNNTNNITYNGFSSSFDIVNPTGKIKHLVKKDRHSKIYTAQGLRDRRVRLSIEIAREFFDLQDMLGFDKASKTLGWLLKNSRKAIKELSQMKKNNHHHQQNHQQHHHHPSLSPLPQPNSDHHFEDQKAALHLLAKESRAKARERARERTREKLCPKVLNNEWKTCPQIITTTSNPQILNQIDDHREYGEKSFGYCQNDMGFSSFKVVVPRHEEQQQEDEEQRSSIHQNFATNKVLQGGGDQVVEESILIKRKLKPSSILGTYNHQQQQTPVMPKDNVINYFPNFTQNWDFNGAIAHSTFRAITNMNLSSGL